MATKKPAAPEKPAKAAPAKKSTSTSLTLWEQEMEAESIAQGSKENLTGGFKSISTKSGVLAIDGNAVEDNELRVVILTSLHENQLYDGDYDASTPATPVCYAFGDDDDTMSPHDAAPAKQNGSCKGCPHNEWGSAEKGRGKACKNVRRLLCVTEDALDSGDDLANAEARMLKLPVMSVRNWSSYVLQTLKEDLKRPSWGVITRIKVVPDAQAQFKITFKFEGLVDFNDETYAAMKKKVKEAEGAIGNAYPILEEKEKPAPRTPVKKVVPIIGAKGKVVAAPAKGKGKY